MKNFLILLLSIVVFFTCRRDQMLSDPTLSATLYVQTAAEYQALCYQAYNVARWRLDQALDSVMTQGETKYAVVVDIDETVLDNSPWQAKTIIEHETWPAYWQEWVDRAEALAVPGALDFLSYASARGVDVFYVSNREVADIPATMRNLEALGFPNVEETYMLFKSSGDGKELRRSRIASDYEILLLCGDNLGDFDSIFDADDKEARDEAVNARRDLFGSRWIVLPNPYYGTWLNVLGDPSKPRHLVRSWESELIGF